MGGSLGCLGTIWYHAQRPAFLRLSTWLIYPCVDLRGTHLCWPTIANARARAHTHLNTSSALPCRQRPSRPPPPRYTPAARRGTNAQQRIATPQASHKQTRYRRARHLEAWLSAGSPGRPRAPPPPPQLHHHQAQRRTIARRYTHIEHRPSPRTADAWVGQPSGDLPRTGVGKFSAWSGYYYTITAAPVRPPPRPGRRAMALAIYDCMASGAAARARTTRRASV